MKRKLVRGLADALDRIGATLVALSIMGAWFTEQVPPSAGAFGIVMGSLAVGLGVYTKVIIDKEDTP